MEIKTKTLVGIFHFIHSFRNSFLFLAFFFWAGFSSCIAQPDMIPYRKGNAWGYCNPEKKILIPPAFQQAGLFNAFQTAIVQKDNQYLLINPKGEQISANVYDSLYQLDEAKALVKKGNQMGLIHLSGKELIPPIYQSLSDGSQGLFWGRNMKGELILLNPDLGVVSTLAFDTVGLFKNNRAMVGKLAEEGSYKKGFIDPQGNLLVDCIYDEVYDFQEGLAAVRLNGKIGFIDSLGKVMIPFEYDPLEEGSSMYAFRNGVASVCKEGRWACINTQHEIILPFEYEGIEFQGDGLLKAIQREKTGLINLQGVWKVQPEYQDLQYFSEKRLAVKKNKRWGFLNEKNKLVVPIKYNWVSAFQKGSAIVVNTRNKWGLINKKGKTLIEFKYEKLIRNGDYFLAEKEGKYGIIDQKGKEIIPILYTDLVHGFQDGLALIGYLKPWGYINKDNLAYWED